MMVATGTLRISDQGLQACTAADGTFVLTLLAHDQISAHQSEPWRITWCGLNAKLFWHHEQQRLQPGQLIEVELLRLWPFGNGRFGSHELHATASRISLPLASAQPVGSACLASA